MFSKINIYKYFPTTSLTAVKTETCPASKTDENSWKPTYSKLDDKFILCLIIRNR
jgi:hypothetical protein